jgi:uncharacterized protein (TIGR03083 family)
MRRLARDERADLAAFLATLSPQQWQAPTLCAQWRVCDVVAHVIGYDELDTLSLLAHAVRGRLRPSRVNAITLAAYSTHSPEQLLALLKAHLQPGGCPLPWAAGSPWPRGSSITRTSGAHSGSRAPSRQNACCPRCGSP